MSGVITAKLDMNSTFMARHATGTRAAGLKNSDISAHIRLRPGNEGVSARGPVGTAHERDGAASSARRLCRLRLAGYPTVQSSRSAAGVAILRYRLVVVMAGRNPGEEDVRWAVFRLRYGLREDCREPAPKRRQALVLAQPRKPSRARRRAKVERSRHMGLTPRPTTVAGVREPDVSSQRHITGTVVAVVIPDHSDRAVLVHGYRRLERERVDPGDRRRAAPADPAIGRFRDLDRPRGGRAVVVPGDVAHLVIGPDAGRPSDADVASSA